MRQVNMWVTRSRSIANARLYMYRGRYRVFVGSLWVFARQIKAVVEAGELIVQLELISGLKGT